MKTLKDHTEMVWTLLAAAAADIDSTEAFESWCYRDDEGTLRHRDDNEPVGHADTSRHQAALKVVRARLVEMASVKDYWTPEQVEAYVNHGTWVDIEGDIED